MCVSEGPVWEPAREKGICHAGVGGSLAFEPMFTPHLTYRMELSSRHQEYPHPPVTCLLWPSGPATKRPLPRDPAQHPI